MDPIDLPASYSFEPPLSLFVDERDCAHPGCHFVVVNYTIPGEEPSVYCTEHNRCSRCAVPNAYSRDLCGVCAHRDPAKVALPCMYTGCTRVAARLSWPAGPAKDFCYEHNTCTGCHKETQWAPQWCVQCMRDSEDNKTILHHQEMKAAMTKCIASLYCLAIGIALDDGLGPAIRMPVVTGKSSALNAAHGRPFNPQHVLQSVFWPDKDTLCDMVPQSLFVVVGKGIPQCACLVLPCLWMTRRGKWIQDHVVPRSGHHARP